jgi:hypothetical protein
VPLLAELINSFFGVFVKHENNTQIKYPFRPCRWPTSAPISHTGAMPSRYPRMVDPVPSKLSYFLKGILIALIWIPFVIGLVQIILPEGDPFLSHPPDSSSFMVLVCLALTYFTIAVSLLVDRSKPFKASQHILRVVGLWILLYALMVAFRFLALVRSS